MLSAHLDRTPDLNLSRGVQFDSRNGEHRMFPAQQRMFPNANVCYANARGAMPTLQLRTATTLASRALVLAHTNTVTFVWNRSR